MKLKRIALTLAFGLFLLLTAGCDDTPVRQLALQLRASVAEDEKLVDDQIARQVSFYQAQQKTIADSRQRNTDFQREAGRRMRSAEAATALSLNPETEVRLAPIMQYLHDAHDKEFEMWEKDEADQQQAREELRSRLVKLERQKKVLSQIKKNLDQLAVKPGSKKRALFLLQYSRETYAKVKAATQQN